MKVRFPLSLKVAVWLLLNLLLLGAIGLGFLLVQGGPGWDAIVRGPAGQRAQDLGNTLVARLVTSSRQDSAGLVKRFGDDYGVTFYVFRGDDSIVAGPRPDLPPNVRGQARIRPPDQLPRRPEADDEDEDFGPPPPDDRPPPPGREVRPGPSRLDDQSRGRFLLRAGQPAAYWLGVRVAPPRFGVGRDGPVTVIARIDSWWGLMRFLQLQSWFVTAAIVLGASILLWLPFVRSLTGGIRRLTAATRHIAEGKFETRVAAGRRDELGQLGESVNAMAARLDALVAGQKRFLADVTHELNSPLARLQIASEIMEREAGPGLRDHVADVREEVQQLAALVSELLAYTRAGMRPRQAALDTISVAEAAAAILRREDPDSRVRAGVPAELKIRADRGLLTLALGNLVRNAVRYAGAAGPISLSARRDGEEVVIAVEDEGPGVPEEALARLGEPFYRPESSRTRETGGVGLGLAIVRSSIGACGGSVAFANRLPRGFRAEIRLRAGT